MRAKEELDLTVDPPPELAVEIDVRRTSTGKLDLYAAFGIAEVWRYEDVALTIYRLDPGRQYQAAASSGVLPGFPLAQVERRLGQADTVSAITLVKSFRQWILAHALPRREGDQ